MILSPHAEQSAAAFQLAGVLQAYEAGVDQLAALGYDPELHAAMTRQVDQMRLYASVLPGLSVSWVGFLVSRFGLTHALWKAAGSAADDAQVLAAHREHKEAIEVLRARCVRVLARR